MLDKFKNLDVNDLFFLLGILLLGIGLWLGYALWVALTAVGGLMLIVWLVPLFKAARH